jgi:hypothetical protein
MSMHEWYSRVRRSARHSVVWATVAALDMAGIIPRSLQANALPDTVRSLLRLATAKNEYQYTIDIHCIYIVYTFDIHYIYIVYTVDM